MPFHVADCEIDCPGWSDVTVTAAVAAVKTVVAFCCTTKPFEPVRNVIGWSDEFVCCKVITTGSFAAYVGFSVVRVDVSGESI